MMDELVQDLVSALEQTSEQNNLGHLWKEMVLSPLRRQRRQIRRRRDRKRRCNPSLHLLQLRRCLSEASESSLDEAAKDCRGSSALAPSTSTTTATTTTASAANYSDSDDMVMTHHRWHSFTRDPVRSRQQSWPESDSFTENTPGRPLRRRRKVKRMTSDVMFRLQRTLKVSGVDGESAFRHRSSSKKKQQRLSGMKKGVSGGWSRANVTRQAEGVGLLATECWKDKIILEAKEQRDASDESMSEGETSSICSSDPGLFTNDEGRQGDDEQSDWFFEGDCGAGTSVAGLMPSWDSDSSLGLEGERPTSRRTFLQPARPSQRGFQARLNQLPGHSGRCIRKGCRRILTKGNSMPMFVDRMKHLSQNPYQRDFRALSFGNRDRSQFSSQRSLPVYPIDMVPDNCHRGCSSSVCRNRQTNVRVGLLCTRDIKRRRKTSALPTRMSADILFHREELGEEAQVAGAISPPEAAVTAEGPEMEEQPAGPDPPDLHQPQTSFDPQGDQLNN
ncbi:G patch domain-containing protein 2-like [Merluccius polli]|uniref:G patch domain-containing protein 2-like n=1 Tax=Merluccius polli TaxID=89951 RepID=A0AA47MR09_MERPO|nr:G patch domain-containing protein 2-like [Merluccius polli]